jgi:FKBP12-rapamycin complex-associated protein
MQIATATNTYSGMLVSQGAVSNAEVPLIARVYLTLASWKRALSPGLDDDAIQGLKNSFFTHSSPFFNFQ